MGRRTEYFCDECKQLFGTRSHLNIKGGDIRVSYVNPNGNWNQHRADVKCAEYHFCNDKCLFQWLGKKIKEAVIAVELKGAPHE